MSDPDEKKSDEARIGGVIFDQSSGRPVRLKPQTPSVDYSQRLISVKGGRGEKNYLQVKDRLQMLREMWPEATIQTDIIYHNFSTVPMETFATVRAVVKLPNGSEGTGHKTEHKNHFEDYVEKAETGAIGRALTAAGVGIQYSAVDFSYEEESDKEFKGVDSEPTLTKAAATKLTREDLFRELTAQADRLGADKIKAEAERRFKVVQSSKLKDAQLEELIAWAKLQS